MPLIFSNPEVDAKFVSLIEIDKTIQRPGTYSGKLSGITPEMAQGMVDRGSNLIALKPAVEKKPVIPAANTGAVKTEEVKT